MKKKKSIYCLGCPELDQSEKIQGSINYCRHYNKILRLESMPGTHHRGSRYPVKCLECVNEY